MSAAAGNGIPGSPSYCAGVNRRSESHRVRQDVAELAAGVDDEEPQAAAPQVVGGGKPGLAGADDEDVQRVAGVVGGVHGGSSGGVVLEPKR